MRISRLSVQRNLETRWFLFPSKGKRPHDFVIYHLHHDTIRNLDNLVTILALARFVAFEMFNITKICFHTVDCKAQISVSIKNCASFSPLQSPSVLRNGSSSLSISQRLKSRHHMTSDAGLASSDVHTHTSCQQMLSSAFSDPKSSSLNRYLT